MALPVAGLVDVVGGLEERGIVAEDLAAHHAPLATLHGHGGPHRRHPFEPQNDRGIEEVLFANEARGQHGRRGCFAHGDARVLGETVGHLGERRIEKRLQVAVSGREPFAFMYLDIDHFKAINDTHGHDVGDVVIQLAKELGDTIGAAFEWDDYNACLEETLGDRLDGLIENGYWVDDAFSGAPWADAFETDSAKFEFTNNDIRTLAAYEPIQPEGDEAGYPLLLVPYDSMRLNGDGQPGTPPFMIKALEDTILKRNEVLVEVNPATAQQLGLSEGRLATLATPKASARVKIRLTQGIMPGVIAIPRGLGHTVGNRFLTGKGANYHQLSSAADDPASGHNAAWGIRAKLS